MDYGWTPRTPEEWRNARLREAYERRKSPEERANAEQRKRARDELISWTLIFLASSGIIIWAARNLVFPAPAPAQAAARDDCPTADVRLNTYEYELQRRTCEAVESGAANRR